MRRTQIYIDESIYKFLRKESQLSGKPMSEIIRESIKSRMGSKTGRILKRTDDVYGIWEKRRFDVKKHVRDLRKDRKSW